MTVAPAPTPAVAPAPAAERRLALPTVRALRWLARVYAVLVLWFAGIVVVLWLGAILVAVRYGDLGQSMAQFARQGMTWFPFSIAIAIFAGYHAAHVAAGMTRRALGAATLLAAMGMAFALGAVVAALFLVERVLYDANGWSHTINDIGWFPVAPGDVLAVGAWHMLAATVAQFSGLLVAVVYQRGGSWRGTLALPFTAGPLVPLMWLLSRDYRPEWLTDGVRIGLVLAVAAVLAAAYLAVLRGFQLSPPRT